jgi:two-component system response regulator FixJ
MLQFFHENRYPPWVFQPDFVDFVNENTYHPQQAQSTRIATVAVGHAETCAVTGATGLVLAPGHCGGLCRQRAARLRKTEMVYRHRKYVVLFGPRSVTLERIAGQLNVLLRYFEGADDCLRYLSKCCCDLLIVDLGGSATEGLEVLRRVGDICPWLGRLAFVGAGGTITAVEVMKMGATECIERPISEELLLSVVEQALSRTESSNSSSLGALTPTELRIVNMVLAGKTSKEIASSLKRSKRTIDAHRSKIMHKLGTSNLMELARWAMSEGFYLSGSTWSARTSDPDDSPLRNR